MNNPLIKENEEQKITPKKEDQSVAQWLIQKLLDKWNIGLKKLYDFWSQRSCVYFLAVGGLYIYIYIEKLKRPLK
jgi:uncharacterized membrane protein SirB2